MLRPLKLSFPRFSWIGPGTLKHLGSEAVKLGHRALVVTGTSGLRKAGTTDRIVDLLLGAGVAVEMFERVPPEPDVGTVDAARKMIRDAPCDLVVEAGGGSALDVGKVAAALAGEKAPTAAFHDGRPIEEPGLPHIAVATTSGTGAEATRNGVITNPQTRLKKSIRGDGVMPTLSITDAELTLSCPPGVTAAAGMDALVQAIESYFSVHAVPTTEALSLGAARLIAASLLTAFRHGADTAARAAMAEGSFMAGLALGSARLGAVHALAHPVGVCYGMPHGAACAVLMPPVLSANRDAAPDKYEALREAMGKDPVAALEGMLVDLHLPRTLGLYPSPEWEREIIAYAVPSGSGRANPVEVDGHYVQRILHSVCDS
jgi:alcohol dehydrogenase class IV